MKNLHVHEVEKYDFDNAICKLVDLNLICQKCHSFHHMGRTVNFSTREQLEDLIWHFMKVNQCDWIDFENHKLEVSLRTLKDRKNRKKINPNDIRFKITGDIPYKEEVIAHLKDEYLYAD